MRIVATLAVLAALLGGIAASAGAYTCTTNCYGSGYNHTCTRTCF